MHAQAAAGSGTRRRRIRAEARLAMDELETFDAKLRTLEKIQDASLLQAAAKQALLDLSGAPATTQPRRRPVLTSLL